MGTGPKNILGWDFFVSGALSETSCNSFFKYHSSRPFEMKDLHFNAKSAYGLHDESQFSVLGSSPQTNQFFRETCNFAQDQTGPQVSRE